VTDVVSGERADDGLYVPVIKRIHDSLKKKGLLYVGDCKMSAFDIRLSIKGLENHYLSPLALTGKTSEEMEKWIKEGVSKDTRGELIEVSVKNDKGEDVEIARGYEFERELSGFNGEEKIEWTERVLIVKSLSHGTQQEKGLEKRLESARKKIEALTPERGRGKKQITEEEILKEKIDGIVKRHNVEGLLDIEYEKEVEMKEKFVGKGRGSKSREKKVIERVRYEVKKVSRNEEKIEEEKEKFGWKAFVTDVSGKDLSLSDAVKCYRHQYGIERIFNRLKSRLDIAPLFVTRNDQIVGLTNLLTLGVRIYTLIEFVVRRSLQKDNAKLGGLHPENKRKETDKPTTERLLKAFSGITLTIIKAGGKTIRHLTPLSELQKEILKRLGLNIALYHNLEINKSKYLLTER
jgi:transposase